MGEVLHFPGDTDLNPDALLQSAEGELHSVLILGVDQDGHDYFAGSMQDPTQALWLLERLKHAIMSSADEAD